MSDETLSVQMFTDLAKAMMGNIADTPQTEQLLRRIYTSSSYTEYHFRIEPEYDSWWETRSEADAVLLALEAAKSTDLVNSVESLEYVARIGELVHSSWPAFARTLNKIISLYKILPESPDFLSVISELLQQAGKEEHSTVFTGDGYTYSTHATELLELLLQEAKADNIKDLITVKSAGDQIITRRKWSNTSQA